MVYFIGMSKGEMLVVELFGTPQGRRANVLAITQGKECVVGRADEHPTKTTHRLVDEALLLARELRDSVAKESGKEVPVMIIDCDAKERALKARKARDLGLK